MQVAINGDCLHVGSVTCEAVIEGLEIIATAGYAPGGSETKVQLIFDHNEAIDIMRSVARIIIALNIREQSEPVGMLDEIAKMGAEIHREQNG